MLQNVICFCRLGLDTKKMISIEEFYSAFTRQPKVAQFLNITVANDSEMVLSELNFSPRFQQAGHSLML